MGQINKSVVEDETLYPRIELLIAEDGEVIVGIMTFQIGQPSSKAKPFSDGVTRHCCFARNTFKPVLQQKHSTRTVAQAATSCASRDAWVSRLQSGLLAAAVSTTIFVTGVSAKPEGVNKPELLPKGEVTPVIDVAGFLTEGEERRIRSEVESLEKDKGIRLRVLAQNYPNTPGLAIKDYWKVDDNTVVFVADPSLGGNILNFNVGSNLDLLVPSNFWSRLAGKFGSKFYWQDKGEGETIVTAVSAIDTCLREPPGKLQCSKIQGSFDEEPSSGGFSKFFFGK